MFDELLFSSSGYEKLAGRGFDPRPAAASVERSAADLQREADDHYAKEDALRREAREDKQWAHAYKEGALIVTAEDPPLGIGLGLASEFESERADQHTAEADEQHKLGDLAKQQAEQARRAEDARKAEQDREQQEAEALDRQMRDAMEHQPDMRHYRDVPDTPRDDDGRMLA